MGQDNTAHLCQFPFIHSKGYYSAFATTLKIASVHRTVMWREHATGWQKPASQSWFLPQALHLWGNHTLSLGLGGLRCKRGSHCKGSQGVSRLPLSPHRKADTRLLAKEEAGKLLHFPGLAFANGVETVRAGKSGAERKVRSGVPGLGSFAPWPGAVRLGFLAPHTRTSPESGPAPGAAAGSGPR